MRRTSAFWGGNPEIGCEENNGLSSSQDLHVYLTEMDLINDDEFNLLLFDLDVELDCTTEECNGFLDWTDPFTDGDGHTSGQVRVNIIAQE